MSDLDALRIRDVILLRFSKSPAVLAARDLASLGLRSSDVLEAWATRALRSLPEPQVNAVVNAMRDMETP
jgi:hypothetical protein